MAFLSVTLIGAGWLVVARHPWNGLDSLAPSTDGVPVEGAGRLQTQSLWQLAVAGGSNRDYSAPALAERFWPDWRCPWAPGVNPAVQPDPPITCLGQNDGKLSSCAC